MAAVGVQMSRSPFQSEPRRELDRGAEKSIPILPSAAAHTSGGEDAMDVSHPHTSSSMPPPALISPNGDRHSDQQIGTRNEDPPTVNGGLSQPVGAAAAAQQPKIVQTAFIHKLYKYARRSGSMSTKLTIRSMLEDQSIQHLISWSNTNESFVMSPSSEFSKVLAYVVPRERKKRPTRHLCSH